jgi:hypothetical protein
VPRLEGEGFFVSGEDAGAEAAEEPHHREIDLTVSPVDGGIDEARLALRVGVQIAAPEIAVQARRWFGRADRGFHAREEAIEGGERARRQLTSIDGASHERYDAFLAVERGPRGVDSVRLRQRTHVVVVRETEARGSSAVQRGEPAPQCFVEMRVLSSRFEVFERQKARALRVVGDGDHRRNAQCVRRA